MSKITWDMFSKRRRINFDALIAKQNINSYEDYANYCNSVNVNPMPKKDFELKMNMEDKIKKEAKTVRPPAVANKPPVSNMEIKPDTLKEEVSQEEDLKPKKAPQTRKRSSRKTTSKK